MRRHTQEPDPSTRLSAKFFGVFAAIWALAMRLLCVTGAHRARPDGRWNGGHRFSSCRDCGRGLVKSPDRRWRIPKDHRIVWKSRAARDAEVAERARRRGRSPGPADRPIHEPRRMPAPGDFMRDKMAADAGYPPPKIMPRAGDFMVERSRSVPGEDPILELGEGQRIPNLRDTRPG